LRLEAWLPMYDSICKEFGFNQSRDLESAHYLAGLMPPTSVESLRKIREDFPRSVTICGGGERLAEEISSSQLEGCVIAADGATTGLMDAEILPDIIVTDLDGIVEDQVEANKEGATVFVHAHGDNIPALKRYVHDFSTPLLGTCQCPPVPGLLNFGGFTDGDRAACICAEFGTRSIDLLGFDFANPSSKVGKDRQVKLKKLAWARRIISTLEKEGVRITSNGQPLRPL